MSISCGGVEVNTVSQTMAEMQMTDLRRYDAVTICALFGMPPEVAGLNPEAQYAHGPAAQRMVTDTVGPLLSFIAAHLNDYVLPGFAGKAHKAVQAAQAGLRTGLRRRRDYRAARGKAVSGSHKLFAWFAVDDHPAIQQQLCDRAEKMLKFIDRGVPLNQVIDAGDLPFEHVPWGDHHWIGAGQVPAQWVLDGELDAVFGPPLAEGDSGEPAEPTEEPAPEKSLSTAADAAADAGDLGAEDSQRQHHHRRRPAGDDRGPADTRQRR